MPEDRLSNYWAKPTNENEFKFNIKGNEADKKKLLSLLQSYKDVFATRLSSAKPARVTPMKMEVDYELSRQISVHENQHDHNRLQGKWP